jgi:uncharacterized protein with HEPN domain
MRWILILIVLTYENVDMLIIEKIVREHLPKLKDDIVMILSEMEGNKGGLR